MTRVWNAQAYHRLYDWSGSAHVQGLHCHVCAVLISCYLPGHKRCDRCRLDGSCIFCRCCPCRRSINRYSYVMAISNQIGPSPSPGQPSTSGKSALYSNSQITARSWDCTMLAWPSRSPSWIATQVTMMTHIPELTATPAASLVTLKPMSKLFENPSLPPLPLKCWKTLI